MFGNGVRTGMPIIPTGLQPIRRGIHQTPPMSFAAALGTAWHHIAEFQAVNTTIPISAITISDFVWDLL
jgi:hypothetical protein